MPAKPLRPCDTPGCPGRAATGRCTRCKSNRQTNPRLRTQTAAERGYDWQWRPRRDEYLLRHPRCTLCGRIACVPDHYPISRKRLVSLGVPDPDADEHLRPLCKSCHNKETARRQPGGWWRDTMP